MLTCPNVKVNFGLNVLRRREDGFHDLETLFVPYYGLSDNLEVISGSDYSRTMAGISEKYGGRTSESGHPCVRQAISTDGKLMITIARQEGVDWEPLNDLCAKAYCLLEKDFDLPAVKIFLEKKSPVGAGLGGGSSDAAFTLKMLNEMFSLGLDGERLASYAAMLGSDCAFFIFNRPMTGRGRGELLSEFSLEGIRFDGCPLRIPASESPSRALESILKEKMPGGGKSLTLHTVIPEGVYVRTSEAYRGITPHIPQIPLEQVLALPVEQWRDTLRNDFEESVFKSHLEIADIKDVLYRHGAVYAAMSGSGSAFFFIG
ncbi:MAG: 4-(cytidine 5'-diphospho)-2-C-methyl-D-erythritol kinase [Candidatus Cryptobacteroides sp.]